MNTPVEQATAVQILLVEDNEDDVLMIRKSIDSAHMINVMHVVSDGVEAMEYLNDASTNGTSDLPGLVLLDINMPRKNGLEVLEEMKAAPALRHIPVVMLTTSQREEDIVASYGFGAATFISKPIDFQKLRTAVERFALYWTLVAKLP